jgi:hypothetical protein
MAPGNDRVTLENEGESPGIRNEKWFIDTYSLVEPRKTFHEEHGSLTKPGHTFVVRNGPPPPADAAKIIRMQTSDLIIRYSASKGDDERAYIERELFKRSINVVVAVDATEDESTDEVYALVESGRKKDKTGRVEVNKGERIVLKLPLQKIWPLTSELVVNVFEWDLTSPDDLIGTLKWQTPFSPTPESLISAGTARYRVAMDIM